MDTVKAGSLRALILILAGAMTIGCSAEARKSRLLDRADRFFNSGDYEKAKIEYLNVLREDPQNEAAIQRMGRIWYEQGAPINAAPFLLKARTMRPDDTDSRMKLALVFMAAGQFELARKEALEVLERSPDTEQAMLVLAEASRSQEEVDDANKRLRGLNVTDEPGFHLALASLALREKDLASATSEVKQALSLDANSVDAHVASAKLSLLVNDLTNADREFKAAAELAPLRSATHLTYAEFKARTGAVDEARASLKEITRKAPDYLPAWRMLAQFAFAQQNLDESLSLLENILLRDPVNIDGRLLQAKVWLAKGEKQKAQESLENLSNSLPKVPAIKYELARAYLYNGNPVRAAAALKEAVSLSPDYGEAILLLGEINLRSGDAQEVIASMLDLLKKRPNLVPAQLLLAEAYLARGRAEEALALIRDQIKASPKDAAGYLRLGLILRRLNRVEEARQAFTQAQSLSPENLMALPQLVDLEIQSRNFTAAKQEIDAQLQKTPQSSIAHFLEGKLYAAQGEWKGAESALTKALELDPNLSAAYELLISTYLASNNSSQAIAQLEAILSKDPKNARALMLSAIIQEKMTDFPKARDAYEKLLTLDPNFAPALNNLAYLYAVRLNDLNKALELAQKARALKSNDPAIADTLGWVLYKRSDYQQALALLRESAQLIPTNPEIQFHLGMASYAMGQTDEARAAFRRAVEAQTSFPDKDEAQRQLSLLEERVGNAALQSSDELEKLLKEKPNDVVAQTQLAESYEKQGAFAQAAAAYEKAIKDNPGLLAATVKLAQLYAGPLQDSGKALNLAKKARELAPSDAKIKALLGTIAYQDGNFSWAYNLLQESARELPNDLEIVHQFAWAAYSVGKVNEAREAMERVVAAASDSAQAKDAKSFLTLTGANHEGTNPSITNSALDEVLKAHPGYVPALMNQAEILLKGGETLAASNIYSEVLSRFPHFAPAQKCLASLYVENPQKRDEAYKLVMKARQTLPEDPELAEILAELSYERKEFAYAVQLLRQSSEKKPLDAKSLYYLGMSHLKANEKSPAQEALEEALAAGLQDPLASQAKSVLVELEHK